MTRNKFALVEKELFVTTSDLLKTYTSKNQLDAANSLVQPQNQKDASEGKAKADAEDKTKESDGEQGSNLVQKMGLTAAMGVMAAGAFFLLKKNN